MILAAIAIYAYIFYYFIYALKIIFEVNSVVVLVFCFFIVLQLPSSIPQIAVGEKPHRVFY